MSLMTISSPPSCACSNFASHVPSLLTGKISNPSFSYKNFAMSIADSCHSLSAAAANITFLPILPMPPRNCILRHRFACKTRSTSAISRPRSGEQAESSRALHERGATMQQQRRQLVGVSIAWLSVLGLYNANPGFAAEGAQEESPAPATPNGLVQRLLERTKANKAKHDEERLNDYYRRNYKDYFNFIKGTIIEKDKDKLTELEKGILEWLEKNE